MRILNRPFRFAPRFGAIAAACILAGAALADGNTVYLSQIGDDNRITVDQSAASNSIVRGAQGPNGVGGGAAAQIGKGNVASIRVRDAGTESDVRFFQRNPSGGTGNSAEVQVGTFAGVLSSQPLAAVASLLQDGDGNRSSISVTGPGSEGAVTQIGTDNTGNLSVTGAGTSGALLQEGNNNTLGAVTQIGTGNIGNLSVTGARSGALLQEGNNNKLDVEVMGNGVAVVYEQIGNDLESPSNVSAQVFSTARQVLIRQTVLGGS
jgi:hypothetical protein